MPVTETTLPASRSEAPTSVAATAQDQTRSDRMQAATNTQLAFGRRGYLGPVPILRPAECRAILRDLRNERPLPPPDWAKGRAATSRLIFDLADRTTITEVLSEVLGADVMLWGASLVTRSPRQIHPWHTDIETAQPDGRTVSVWIGLQGTNALSSMSLVPGSHNFGMSIQQVANTHGRPRGKASEADIKRWAQQIDPHSDLIRPEIGNGEAVFFDGRLWHGSDNRNRSGTRVAILLQYATPGTSIRIPDFDVLEWPFRYLDNPRPKCIMILGSSNASDNRHAQPPPRSGNGSTTALTTWTRSLNLPLEGDPERGWKPHHVFRGSTPGLDTLSCHVSVLNPGVSPHPPHAHEDEEVLMVLRGRADLLVSATDSEADAEVLPVEPGSIIYYPAHQHHTIRNSSDSPVTYLMLKWRAAGAIGQGDHGSTELHHYPGEPLEPSETGLRTELIFQHPTAHLGLLHAHFSTLSPGGGYEPHVDAYDVAIVVLTGAVETLGQVVPAGGVIFYASGETHGMYNPGSEMATYVVFEFHRTDSALRRHRSGFAVRVYRSLRRRLGQVIASYPMVGRPARWLRQRLNW